MRTSAARSQATALAALSTLGIEVSGLTPLVAPAPWSAAPRAYRATATDGSVLKVRISRRADLAARSAELSHALGDHRVPPPLGRVGRVTTERWIEGDVVTSLRLRPSHVDDAAELLATVHRFAGPDGRLPRRRASAPARARFEGQLAELAAAGAISATDASALAGMVRRGLPPTSAWGLTHGDFGGDNLVCCTDGALVSIDHELLGRGFLDYDLARSWYRWPMPPWARQRFEHRYRRALARPPLPEAASRAWRAVATVNGVHLRHRRRAPFERGREALATLLS